MKNSPTRVVARTARKVPVVGKYVKSHQNLKRTALEQKNEITGLREAVDRLEKRNEVWADEVRELRGENQAMHIIWPVKKSDLIAADWRKPTTNKPGKNAKAPFTINWVVPSPGRGSGGHTDIFRTIHYLESKGHTCRVYFYDALESLSFETIKENLKSFPTLKAELFYNAAKMEDCDAIFATNWFTAYPVYNFKGTGKKYYYVQDFEPFFEAVGTYYTLAESTYRFGFRGLTLGRWLTDKLSREYNMTCDYFELGTEQDIYKYTNKKPRKKILFYARPVTPRRGFELGVLALELFHKQHPEYEIHFLGWDTSRYDIPFPYVNHGIMSVEELNELYNECVAGLVISFTNMSLTPLEMLATGCIPIVNNAEHTRAVGYAEKLKYAAPTPTALAEALYEVVTAKDAKAQAASAAEYTQKFQWDASNAKIEQILLDELSASS